MATLSAGLLGDENDLLSMNLLHLFGSKLDNKFPGSSFHRVAFHLEVDGVSRCQCPRKFKGTQTISQKCHRGKMHHMGNQAPGANAACGKALCSRAQQSRSSPGVWPVVSALRQDGQLEWLLYSYVGQFLGASRTGFMVSLQDSVLHPMCYLSMVGSENRKNNLFVNSVPWESVCLWTFREL